MPIFYLIILIYSSGASFPSNMFSALQSQVCSTAIKVTEGFCMST